MTTITVPASTPYEVRIEAGLLSRAGAAIAEVTGPCTAAVVADDCVDKLFGDTLCQSLTEAGFRVVRFVFPHGEQSKNLAVYGEILNFLAEAHLTRSDLLVALGGGVAGDMGGFAAATYLRGIKLVQVPTTLLSAVDSSVGGKTAVDLPAGKNLVGCFWQPALVLCDYRTLERLPDAIYREGCAEAIKYGILESEEFFREMQKTPIKEQLEHVIAQCVTMKSDLVAQDEYDRGSRALLNLGHSFGHAVEACSGFTVSHGNAVAIGTALIARAACRRGYCSEETLDDILSILRQYELPTETEYSAELLLAAMLSDKKLTGSTMHLIVPEAIGRCRIEAVPAEELRGWLNDGGVQ